MMLIKNWVSDMRDIFIDQLSKLAEKDKDIFLITADLGFGVLTDFQKRFPKQYLNVGVAEQNMTSIAAGLALSGKKVFTYSIANFPTLRCLEQFRNDVCYHNLNVNIVSIGGGFSYGSLGVSHHACEDIAIFRTMPNVVPVIPSDSDEVRQATNYLAEKVGPGFLRLDKTLPALEDKVDPQFAYGKVKHIRAGNQLSVFTAGGVLKEVNDAAGMLADMGINVAIYSMPFPTAPDGMAIAAAVNETGGILTVEEGALAGGLGSAIAEYCLDNGLMPRKFKRIGLPRTFVSNVGDQNYLRAQTGLDAHSLRDEILKMVV